jgi:hypothetical protein
VRRRRAQFFQSQKGFVHLKKGGVVRLRLRSVERSVARANAVKRVSSGSTDGSSVCVSLAQDRLTSVIIPVAGCILGTALLTKGMVDLTTGTNKKEGF